MLVQIPAQGPPEVAAEPADSPRHTESAQDVTRLWRGHALVSNTASEAPGPMRPRDAEMTSLGNNPS